MPICTTCTHRIPYLYTAYESANNLRLEQCPECLNFADPYVEHDSLTLLLDLILLKRDVFRHLLFNRGYEPRRALGKNTSVSDSDETTKRHMIESQREKARWKLILQLGMVLVFVDAFIRWSHLNTSDDPETVALPLRTKDHIEPLLRIFAGCIIETIAFHTGVALTSLAVLKTINLWKSTVTSNSPAKRSGVREELRLSHVPLTLLYSSMTKLFLLLLLALWKPSSVPSTRSLTPVNGTEGGMFQGFLAHDIIRKALEILDDDKLDREWVVRNVLGGMAAGFGLRVVLDIQPVFTTIIILFGWAVKTFVAEIVSIWVNESESTGEVFLAYSIP